MTDVPLVLVADDEPTMREMVAHHLRTLTSPQLDVIEAGDGEEALRMARERLPDLVVLDVMMPEMSGWEVCKKIREDVSLAHTGVVMLTGIGHPVNELTSPLYGADAYIDKPFEFPELDAKIKQALALRKKQRDAVPRPDSSTDVNGVIGLAKASPRGKAGSARGKAAKGQRGKARKQAKAAPKKKLKAAPKRKKAAPKKKAARSKKKSTAKKKKKR
jgi:DNA-binding response OmpR family regulator